MIDTSTCGWRGAERLRATVTKENHATVMMIKTVLGNFATRLRQKEEALMWK
jgi:hypothetical protein